MKLSYLKELDGIRAVAALMVMVCHFENYWSPGIPAFFLNKAGLIGQMGVSLFFVLSGFLITRILLTTVEEVKYFKNFYIRRSLRIFPLYYLALLFYYFVHPLLLNESVPPFIEQIYYWLYLQDFAITFNWKSSGPFLFWSLAIEEHFYLFWPLLVFVLSKRGLVLTICALILLSMATRGLLVLNGYQVFYFFTFARLDELAMGSLLAVLRFGKPSSKRIAWSAGLLVACLIPLPFLFDAYSGEALPAVQVFKYSLFALILTCFLGLVLSVEEDSIWKRIFRIKPLIYSGKISYGLYVFHPFCFVLYNRYFHSGYSLIDFSASFLLTYLIAGLSFKYVESYFLRMKDRFNYSEVSAIKGLTKSPELKSV